MISFDRLQCPYGNCREKDCVPAIVLEHSDYGSRQYDIPCVHCGEMIRVNIINAQGKTKTIQIDKSIRVHPSVF